MSIPQEVHRARVKLMPCYTRPTKEGLQSIISGYRVYIGMVKNILARFHPIVLLVEKNPLLFMQQPTEKPPPQLHMLCIHMLQHQKKRDSTYVSMHKCIQYVSWLPVTVVTYRYATTYVHMYICIYHVNISSGGNATLTVSAIL